MTGRNAEGSTRRIALICASIAILVSVAAVLPAIGAGGGVSSLVRLPREEALGQHVAESDPGFSFVEGAARYDGLYFYAFALDPFATGAEHRLIDSPAYRYGHAGYGWAAAVLTLGTPTLVPAVLLLLSILGMAVAAAAASIIAVHVGASPWLGLSVPVNAGLVYAVTSDTSEAFAAGVLGLGLVAWLKDRIRWAGLAFVALCLIKEPFVMVPLGLGAWEVIERMKGRGSPDLWGRLGWLAAGPAALAAWFVYLQAKFGVWPFAEGPENLGLPLSGWVETLGLAADLSVDAGGYQIGAASLPLLVAVGAALVMGCVRAARFRTAVDPVFLGFVLVIACLTWLALLYPKDMMRNVAPACYLLPLVLVAGKARVVPADERNEGSLDVEEGRL